MRPKTKTLTILQLLALAYLGFYAWGLAMSVFTAAEGGVLTVIAAALLLALVVSVVVTRATRSDAEGERTIAQIRERRGF